MPNNEGNALLHLKLELQRDLCKGDSLLYIREHWGIENRLHWQLDVTFREDACRARKNFSARNLNLIRKFSLAILRQQHDTLSLKARRRKCSLHIDYLKQVLGF